MRKPNQVTIDGEQYEVGYLTSSQAIETATLLAKRLIPSVGNAFASFMVQATANPDIQVADALKKIDFGDAIPQLAAAMDPKEINGIVKLLCGVTSYEGPDEDLSKGLLDKTRFEEHFKGRPGHALKVAQASFEVNCSDFFGAAVSVAMEAMSLIRAKTT